MQLSSEICGRLHPRVGLVTQTFSLFMKTLIINVTLEETDYLFDYSSDWVDSRKLFKQSKKNESNYIKKVKPRNERNQPGCEFEKL